MSAVTDGGRGPLDGIEAHVPVIAPPSRHNAERML
jgi:hypothetical protein